MHKKAAVESKKGGSCNIQCVQVVQQLKLLQKNTF